MANTTKAETIGLPQLRQRILSKRNNQYFLEEILGEGGYGTVFRCVDQNQIAYALKAEKLEQCALKRELDVLRTINKKNCKHFCKLFDWGKSPPNYMFIVMTLLGKDLARVRNLMPNKRFTLGTAIRVGMQTANALHELHMCRFISRDVKPGNFAHGFGPQRRLVFLIDFGLAKDYIDSKGRILPPMPNVGWRGTVRYGSLRAHRNENLCRKDDFESWIYMLVEFTKGMLPWRVINERAKVLEEKLNARLHGRQQFLSECPPCYDQLLTMIDEMKFETEPAYQTITEILYKCCMENKVSMDAKYDWEPDEAETTTNTVGTESTTTMSTTTYDLSISKDEQELRE